MDTLLLAVLALCAVILTALALSASVRLHHTLQQTVQILDKLQRLFLRANKAAGHVEATVHRACDTASIFLDDVSQARQRVASFLVRGKKRKGEVR
ncbi:MAG: hypothetical protein HYZ88_00500 [Candidatus Omnitrophica bacterium]|nr:hypothetical protein [Candidatus Omnitrophota bacterium]